MDLKFQKCERLTKKGEYKNVFENGHSHRNMDINFYILSTNLQSSRIGIIARKSIGNSVKRNRTKRLIREAFRKNKNILTRSFDIIVIPKSNQKEFTLKSIESSLIKLFNRIKK